MAGVLIFSPKCNHCREIISYIQGNKQLSSMIQYHNVNTQGIPQQYASQITRVPTMLTSDKKFLVGNEIKAWLVSLLPSEISQCSLGGCMGVSSIEGDEDDGNIFTLENYGQSLQPAMTPELQAKITKKVSDAFDSYKD